jgi:ketosteroid isomerase-like protein
MSQENVEIVLEAIQAFNRRDLRTLAELADEDLEFVSVLAAVDAEGGTYRGPDLWASYFDRMGDTWEDWQIEDFRAFDAGDDRVAAVYRLVGTGKSSGAHVERAVGIVYRLRHRKVGECGPIWIPMKPSNPLACQSKTLTPTDP